MRTTSNVRRAMVTVAALTVASLGSAVPVEGRAHPQRPVKAALTGPATSTPAFVDPDLVYSFCDVDQEGLIQAEVTGRMSHLGRTEASFWHCFDEYDEPIIVDGFVELGTIAGEAVFVAANGDTLTAEYTGVAQNALDEMSARTPSVMTVTGGTGRFSGASGTIDLDVTAVVAGVPPGVVVEMTLRGRLRY